MKCVLHMKLNGGVDYWVGKKAVQLRRTTMDLVVIVVVYFNGDACVVG